MKKLNLIINVVLVIAVGFLFFLHFKSQPDSVKEESEPAKAASILDGNLSIAFIKIDTVLSNMSMYADLTDDLNSKQKKLESNFTSQYQAFEKEVSDYQSKVTKGLLTRREAQEVEANLGNKQMELENKRNNYLTELQEEGIVAQNKVINYIMEYLTEYNSDNRFEYIFSYSFGGNLLYANNGLDITSEVLEGLNQKYAAEQAEK